MLSANHPLHWTRPRSLFPSTRLAFVVATSVVAVLLEPVRVHQSRHVFVGVRDDCRQEFGVLRTRRVGGHEQPSSNGLSTCNEGIPETYWASPTQGLRASLAA